VEGEISLLKLKASPIFDESAHKENKRDKI